MSRSYAVAYYDCDVRFHTVEVKGVLCAQRVVSLLTETNSINLGENEKIDKQEWRRMKQELAKLHELVAELQAKLEGLSVGEDCSKKELPVPSAPPGGPTMEKATS